MRDAQSRAQGWGRRLVRIAGWLLLTACAVGAEKSGPSEYEMKGAFLYTFAQFTEWPAAAFDSPAAPLINGVTGSDPFGHILDDARKGESIHGRPAVIRRFQRGESLKSCHVVFVGASEKRQAPQILAELKGANVLTISEIDRFACFGGIITFTMEGPRVRFEINLAAAGQARLKISSKLLKLAKITGGAP